MRRSAAAVFGSLFILQLVLASGAAACRPGDLGAHLADTHAGASSGALSDGMDGMNMAGMPGESGTNDSPCDYPVTPEQCETMAPCTIGFLPAIPTAELPETRVIEAVVATRVAMPPSVSFPPRHRPPRA